MLSGGVQGCRGAGVQGCRGVALMGRPRGERGFFFFLFGEKFEKWNRIRNKTTTQFQQLN